MAFEHDSGQCYLGTDANLTVQANLASPVKKVSIYQGKVTYRITLFFAHKLGKNVTNNTKHNYEKLL